MENRLKLGVDLALKTFNNGFNSIICTGDNEKNTTIDFKNDVGEKKDLTEFALGFAKKHDKQNLF